jgi:hypothetical protein
METSKTHKFAILAPVPEEHLITGLDTIAAQLDADSPEIPPVVAYGSGAFEVFDKADAMCEGLLVEMFFYASHPESPTFKPFATWKATYLKQLHSRRGRYPGKKFHRPPSTESDSPTWAIFWLVQDLEKLDTPIPIEDFRGLDKKSNYTQRFIPEGPMLVDRPGRTK